MINRRDFIKQSALISAGALIAPKFVLAKPFNKIGLQLYTLRDEIVKDVKGVIGKVAKCGYGDVETYDYNRKTKFWGLSASDFSKLLKDNGLVSTSGHYGMEQLITTGKYDDIKFYLEGANIVGQKYIVLPHLAPELVKTSDQYKGIADKLNKAAEVCKSAGVHLSYHNHNFEFDKLPDGQLGYDILLKNTDPSFKFEMDLYWVVRAGHDPVQLFSQHPGRFVMWHVKDMSRNNPDMQTEVGKGKINFENIFAHAKQAGVERFFMEQENNYHPDIFGSIAQSEAYIKQNLM